MKLYSYNFLSASKIIAGIFCAATKALKAATLSVMMSFIFLISSSESKPTKNAYVVFDDLSAKIDAEIKKIKDIITDNVAAFNAFVAAQKIPAIILEADKKL